VVWCVLPFRWSKRGLVEEEIKCYSFLPLFSLHLNPLPFSLRRRGGTPCDVDKWFGVFSPLGGVRGGWLKKK